MADLQSTIDLIFNGIDNASGVAKKVSLSLGDLGDSAQRISQPFADVAARLLVFQTGLTALAVVLGGVAFGESAKFQSSLAALQKQMDESEGSAGQYAAVLAELALKYGENNNELVKSAADFKAAGYDIQTSVELVKGSLDLAIAGSIKTSEATDLMNRSLAGFQVPAGDVVRVSREIGDTLNKAADITKSSFTELAQGFADLSPIAKQTGLSIQETTAILTTVIDVFGSGAESARALQSGFLSLVDPSTEAKKAMQTLGVAYQNVDGSLKPVKDILTALAEKFGGLDASQKLATASIIFGKDQAGKMVVVLEQFGTAMDRAATLSTQAGGSIEKEVTAKLTLAETQGARTQEAFRQLFQVLGDATLVNTSGVIRSIGDLAVAFRDVVNSGDLDPLFAALRTQLGGIETLFKTIANNLPAAFDGLQFDGLLQAFAQLGEAGKAAFEALFGPIDLSTVNGLREAMQKVVDLITALVRVTAGELGGLAPFLEAIKTLAAGFMAADGSTQTFIGSLLGLGAGLNKAAGTFEAINTALLAFVAFGPQLATIPALIGGMASGFAAFAASSAGFAAGIAGAATGVGLLAFEITRMTGLDQTLNDVLAPDWLAGEGATLGTWVADLAEKLGVLGPTAGQAAQQMQPLPPAFAAETAAARETRVAINDWLDAQERGAKVAGDSKAEIAALTETWKQLGYAYDATTGALTQLADAQEEVAKDPLGLDNVKIGLVEQAAGAVGNYATALGGVSTSYSQVDGRTVKATGAFKAVAASTKEVAQQTEEATKKADEFKIKMEEIASNERIKTMEFAVNLKVAQVQADAERVKAAFASIGDTLKSTGEVLGGLFSMFGSAKTEWDKLKINSWIDEEFKRRDQALELQKKMTEAEIERVKAQTDALNRGASLIEIDGKGLQPQLEAFMFEILKAIRVKLTGSYSDFLLALGAVP